MNLWKGVWKMRVPPKVKVFLWRTMLDSLPTLTSLQKQNITSTSICTSCCMEEEDLIHVLVRCPHAKPVWFASALGGYADRMRQDSFISWQTDLSSYFRSTSNQSLLEYVAIICSQIWKARNETQLEYLDIYPMQVLKHANCMLQEYCLPSIQDPLQSPAMRMQRTKYPVSKQHGGLVGRSALIPPPSGILKFNSDASYLPSSGVAALVEVGRNSDGFICAGRVQRGRALSSFMAKVVALLMAVQLAIRIQVQNSFFESDCKVLIECVNNVTNQVPWEASIVVSDLRRIKEFYIGFEFCFVPRNGNLIADWLARMSIKDVY